ncbi:MAG: hypothetical protein CM1200mP30_08320 [Pseudomonadota bacterium]|nr:MAG: hypothetical protein CM1200mP30_08320 [Pseudomonadota bacterium]
MRISSYCGGFKLYEVMISITAVGIISDLITVSLLPLLDRSEFVKTADQFKTLSDWQSGWRLQNESPTELIVIQNF